HVVDGSRLIVESTAPLDTEVLRHGDLHALDVLTVPERLQERVGKTEEQHVTHRSLAQVMIDAEDVVLVECSQQDAVEGPRGAQVVAERLLDNDSRTNRSPTHLRQTL